MPWMRNNNIDFSPRVRNYVLNGNNRLHWDLYRSRITIDDMLGRTIFAPLNLFGNGITYRMRISSRAIARGLEVQDIVHGVRSGILDLKTGAQTAVPGTIYLRMYNTANNPTMTPAIKTMLEENYRRQPFDTALTCHPFHNIDVYYIDDANAHIIIVLTNAYSDEVLCKLAAVIPGLLGIEYPEELVDALLEGDKLNFINAVDRILREKEASIQEQEFDTQLNALKNMLASDGQDGLLNDIQSLQSHINNILSNLRTNYDRLKDLQIRHASTFWSNSENAITEFIDYLKNYAKDHILKMECVNGTLKLTVETKLLYWDEQDFKSYATAGNSNVVTDRTEAQQHLLRNIFKDRTVEVIFNTGIKIRFGANDVDFYPEWSREYYRRGLHHSHIHYANCWGNNRPLITEALANRDYIMAWEQIKSTLSGLTLTDYTIFKRFIQELFKINEYTDVLYIPSLDRYYNVSDFIKDYPEGYKEDVSNEVH